MVWKTPDLNCPIQNSNTVGSQRRGTPPIGKDREKVRKIAKIGRFLYRCLASWICFGGETGGRGSILLAPEKGESKAILTAVFHKLRFENSRGGMTNSDTPPLLKFDYAGVRKLFGIILIINML